MKQVPLIDEVHEDLIKIVAYKKDLFKRSTITIKSVVADLITKEAKRIERKECK